MHIPFSEEQTIFISIVSIAFAIGFSTLPLSAYAAGPTPAQRSGPANQTILNETLETAAVVANPTVAVTKPALPPSEVLSTIDFTDYDQSTITNWLTNKGFTLKADANDSKKIALDFSHDGLVIEAKKSARALIVYDGADLPDAGKIRITWKVDQYPLGANYDSGVRNEALMVIIFFGQDRIASGSPFVPDSPFFIGLFLCGEGSIRKSHVGRYFQKGGRYVCLDQPEEGKTIVSEYDLSTGFKDLFEPNAIPIISGMAIQADTTVLKSDATSKGTIKSVQFLR